jgi:hypothetical protein
MITRIWIAGFLFLIFILSACSSSQSTIETAVAQTLQISQLETAAALANQPISQPEGAQTLSTDTLPPTETQEPPVESAPDPLPAFNTGFMLNNGECLNFDNGQVGAPDADCDIWLVEPALFRQMNGAQLSGYVTMTAPTRTHCKEARYEPDDLAIQTDLYMCFITNEGKVGFIVARSYLGGIPSTGIVVDYWVFD